MKTIAAYFLMTLSAIASAQEASKPVKVFTLARQSNMEGAGQTKADAKSNGGQGLLEFLVKDAATAKYFAPLVAAAGQWQVREVAWIPYHDRKGPLTAGYGARRETIDPELDHQIGQVLKTLEAEGLLENTLIIYTSDHGDFVGNHGLIEKSATSHNVHEDTLRMPLIISWQGKSKVGLVSDDLAQLADLYPTLMQLCGMVPPKQPAAYAGTSLAPVLINGQPLDRDFIVSENWSQTTIVGKRFKFGRMNDTDKTIGKRNFTGFGDMMFDRQNDPLELTNIAASPEYAAEKATLQKQLAQWGKQFPGDARKEQYLHR